MAATYTKTPKTWAEADGVFKSPRGHRPQTGRDQKLGNQTWLVLSGEKYAIRHWETLVVFFLKDGDIVLNGEKVSQTTAERMNAFTPDTVSVTTRGVHTDEPHYVIKTSVGTRLLFEGDTTTIKAADMLPPLPQRTSKRSALNGQAR